MRRFASVLVLIFMTAPAWSAKKVTVAELIDVLKSLQAEKKNDASSAR